jgi:hypothetical protein
LERICQQIARFLSPNETGDRINEITVLDVVDNIGEVIFEDPTGASTIFEKLLEVIIQEWDV